MGNNELNAFHERLHRIATFFFKEIGSVGVTEIVVETKLFDMLMDHVNRHTLILAFPAPLKIPPDTMVINILGEPVTIRCVRKPPK